MYNLIYYKYPECLNHPCAILEVTASQASIIGYTGSGQDTTSIAYWRSHALILEKADSIGFKSGEYGGRKTSLQPLKILSNFLEK